MAEATSSKKGFDVIHLGGPGYVPITDALVSLAVAGTEYNVS